MFGPFVIAYLFLGGCGSGALFVSSVHSLVFHGKRRRAGRVVDAFHTFRDRCFLAGFVAVCAGAMCLLADLGRPDRFVLLFLRPTCTYLTFGSFVLALTVVCSGFLLCANYLYIPWVTTRMKRTAEVLCAACSAGVAAYTGLFLHGIRAVALWDTWALPLLFVFSALSMGISTCLVMGSFLRDFWLVEAEGVRLRRMHMAVLVIETGVLAWFVGAGMHGPGAAPASVGLLLDGPLAPWFIGGAMLCGIGAPFGREAASALGISAVAFPLADALCIAGGLALRFCVVCAGLH